MPADNHECRRGVVPTPGQRRIKEGLAKDKHRIRKNDQGTVDSVGLPK